MRKTPIARLFYQNKLHHLFRFHIEKHLWHIYADLYQILCEISNFLGIFSTSGDTGCHFLARSTPLPTHPVIAEAASAVTCESRHAPVFQAGKEPPGITYAAFKPREQMDMWHSR